MSSLKKFVGDYAYSYIKNMEVDPEKLRKALVTPQNARNVFSELDEFQIKSICFDICADDTFGVVRETTQEEIIEDFNKAGYDTVIFDDKEKIRECEKYYASGERICTYSDLSGRMQRYHMIVAIKKNIDDIKRSDIPKRDDEYGTSILNIQIAKNGSHMSIKNRYNHTVKECDSTLNNNLDLLTQGLQAKVLGYYNIAHLNKTNNYYKNIVVIKGIYLKYTCERRNIYFGDFVLDGENGVRYEDHSRYYILDDDVYLLTPSVLDFKEKKTINVFSKGYQNVKDPLLSRALQEKIVHSGNKEKTNELSIVFPNAKKELLHSNSRALQFIAEHYGYDFQQPFDVTAILGKFTANSITKITGYENAVLLICSNDYLKCVELKNGKFAVDVKRGYDFGTSYYWTKGDFEQDRKTGKLGVYIITQDSKYKRPNVGRKSAFALSQMYKMSIYDHSGCDLTETRKRLQERLKRYKAEKRKQEVDLINYDEVLEKFKERFELLQNDLLLKLANAKCSKDFEKIKSVFGWYGIDYLLKCIEDFEDRTNNKKFRSVENAKCEIENITKTLEEIENNLLHSQLA